MTSPLRARAAVCAAAALALGWGAAPALANSAAADYFRVRSQHSEVPTLLTADDRAYYRALFAAIAREDWTGAEALFAQRADGPLHTVARARLTLAATSPRVEAEPLLALIERARELPWAEQLGRLAAKRGAEALPEIAATQRLVALAPPPQRIRPRSTADGTMPEALAAAILEAIKADDPAGARAMLDGIDPLLSPEARAEWRQRVAWSFYIENDDLQALALARSVADGRGPWVAEGWWTAGLAAWRTGDCAQAGDAFQRSAAGTGNQELAAAALYWASRAWLRCRRPELVAVNLRAAAHRPETLYGMLAGEALGLRPQPAPPATDFGRDDWPALREVANVRAAVQLVEIGETELAGDVLRHQARIGSAAQYPALTRLAGELGLPSLQLWMAYNAPRGGRPDGGARYPAPKWVPLSGWRVDPGLVYAHALQESRFGLRAVSPANARGLMQITPITVRQHGPALALSPEAVDLAEPRTNLAFGQRNLEMLRDSSATQGLLPKVVAAYNAGLAPLARWNGEIRDGGDPLLWIESIPYWETRGYVSVVLRNYWMYQKQAGAASDSRIGLAQGLWPKFPGLAGARAVRLAARGH